VQSVQNCARRAKQARLKDGSQKIHWRSSDACPIYRMNNLGVNMYRPYRSYYQIYKVEDSDIKSR
jgi:hypothetical protein